MPISVDVLNCQALLLIVAALVIDAAEINAVVNNKFFIILIFIFLNYQVNFFINSRQLVLVAHGPWRNPTGTRQR